MNTSQDGSQGYHSHISGVPPLDVSLRHWTPCTVCIQINSLTHVAVLLSPYDDHRASQSFELIAIFTWYIWLEACSQCYLPKRVLHQFRYEQTIPQPSWRRCHWWPIDALCRPSCYQCDTSFTSLSLCSWIHARVQINVTPLHTSSDKWRLTIYIVV